MAETDPLTSEKVLSGIKSGIIHKAILEALKEQGKTKQQLAGQAAGQEPPICSFDTALRWLADEPANDIGVTKAEQLALLLGIELLAQE